MSTFKTTFPNARVEIEKTDSGWAYTITPQAAFGEVTVILDTLQHWSDKYQQHAQDAWEEDDKLRWMGGHESLELVIDIIRDEYSVPAPVEPGPFLFGGVKYER